MSRDCRKWLKSFDRAIREISDEYYGNMPPPTILEQPYLYIDPAIEALNIRLENNRIMT